METWLLPLRNTQFVWFLGILQTPENRAGAKHLFTDAEVGRIKGRGKGLKPLPVARMELA